MKKALVITLIAVAIAQSVNAQLGGLLKKVSAGGLTGDVASGMDFFLEAQKHYVDALFPKEEASKMKADLDALKGKIGSQSFLTNSEKLKTKAEELSKDGKKLSDEAKAYIKKGDAEFAKGVAKWVALGASLAMAAKDGGKDAALLTAIPVAQQAVKDLPQIKKMSDAISALNKIK